MKKAVLLTTSLTLAVLLASAPAISAEEKTAVAKSAVGAEGAPLKAAETVPARAPETAPMKAPAAELLDINSASALQLQKVLGIGEELAKMIIAGRPYVKKDQLKSRKILTAAHYYKIKDRIIARRPAGVDKTDRS